MPRPRKPTQLHVVNGNPGKRALNKQEPDAEYVEDLAAPAHLSEASAAVWDDLAPRLRKSRLLTVLDLEALEMLCDAVADYRNARDQCKGDKEVGAGGPSPWAIVKSMSFKRAQIGFSAFGMSPAARVKVLINPQGDLFGNGDKEKKYFA